MISDAMFEAERIRRYLSTPDVSQGGIRSEIEAVLTPTEAIQPHLDAAVEALTVAERQFIHWLATTGGNQSVRPEMVEMNMTHAIESCDGAAFGIAFGNTALNLAAVLYARRLLEPRGMFEEALVMALSTAKTNHRATPLTTIREALATCDANRLRASGDPLPADLGDVITAYRGVAGPARTRRIAGVSWTLDRAQARWFADRSAEFTQVGRGEVYEISVPRSRVLVYLGDREEEVIILAKRHEVRRLADDLRNAS